MDEYRDRGKTWRRDLTQSEEGWGGFLSEGGLCHFLEGEQKAFVACANA